MERNNLYPIFLKTNEIKTLIVGGGNVALEKLTFLLKSSPDSIVEMISPQYSDEVIALASQYAVKMHKGKYKKKYLKAMQIVIATTDKLHVNLKVYKDCTKRKILVNLADNPTYCNFYMGSIVTKGNVKIAISTNGKSPTTAKRLRQFFEEAIPNEIDDLVINLREYRKTIKGGFEQKVKQLNKFTESLIKKDD